MALMLPSSTLVPCNTWFCSASPRRDLRPMASRWGLYHAINQERRHLDVCQSAPRSYLEARPPLTIHSWAGARRRGGGVGGGAWGRGLGATLALSRSCYI